LQGVYEGRGAAQPRANSQDLRDQAPVTSTCNKHLQDVRSAGAMQPALPKNGGIAATTRQSCDVFGVALLPFNQGF
jgi:hypothetical protein